LAHTPTAAAASAVPCLDDLQILHQERQIRLSQSVAAKVLESQAVLQRLQMRLQRVHPERLLNQELNKVSSYRIRLLQATRYRLRSHQQHHQFLQEKLTTLDPREVLRRGYAIARTLEGKIVRREAELKPDQTFLLQLQEGSLYAKVIPILENCAIDQIPLNPP
jgi:exodeoxyribonuclease VII large subunit